jgi:hypothetical protein
MRTEGFGGPIGRKYANIDRVGRKALSEGEIQRFEGFPGDLKNRFNVAAQFAPASEREFVERVTGPAKEIAAQLGIDFMVAGEDFPIHSTMLEGLYQGDDDAERQKLFADLQKDAGFQDRINALNGLEVPYKYLLMDKGNVILNSVEIPDDILELRQFLTKYYAEKKLKPLAMDNILHISAARMVKLPEEEQEKSFAEYRRRMVELRHSISSEPLSLKIDHLHSGSTLQLLKGFSEG